MFKNHLLIPAILLYIILCSYDAFYISELNRTLIDFWCLMPLSAIFQLYLPGFVNYKKGCTRLSAASDKVYQLLAHGRWFSLGTPVSSTTKTGCHDISESGVKTPKIKINHKQHQYKDTSINRVLSLPQGNHVAKFGKDPIYRTKVIVRKPVWTPARPPYGLLSQRSRSPLL
jgi:hypothetical protein